MVHSSLFTVRRSQFTVHTLLFAIGRRPLGRMATYTLERPRTCTNKATKTLIVPCLGSFVMLD
jgi:hypothetical protein